MEGWGTIKKASVDGTSLKRRADGPIILPGDFTAGTVKIQMERRSGT